jgi:Sec-independent protein secretion pathway component TatC
LKASVFYRIASGLLLLFAALHTFGFRQVDPEWGVGPLIHSMQSIRFDLMGSSRTYWELFVAFGLLFSVFLVFAAVLAWQLGGLPDQTLSRLRGTAWAFIICFAAVTIVCLRYAFILPIVFSILILFCLTAAAWLTSKRT